MSVAQTIPLNVFERQVLPLLRQQHSDDAALHKAIDAFCQQTRILDEHDQEVDVRTLSLPADESEVRGTDSEQLKSLVRQTLAELRQQEGAPVGKARHLRSGQGDQRAQGFGSLGEFALAVHKASARGGAVDSRLLTKTPTTWAGESAGDSGGFLVPQEWSEKIWQLVIDEESLLARTNRIPTSRNSLSLPVSESTPWGTSGVQAYWVDEGQQIAQSRPQFEYRNLRLHKLAALVPASDELLEDATALTAFIGREAARAIRYKADDAILHGDGVAKPLGVFNSGALVTVSKESSQDADTLLAENVARMYARMPASSINRAVWVMNQDVLPQLLNLTLGNQPVYLPPNGISDAPFGTLLGRPIILSQHCKSLGDLGDVLFADMQQYLALTKSAPLQASSSVHLWFDYDLTAFRFTFRLAGQPWLSSPVTGAYSSAALSPFVTLEAR